MNNNLANKLNIHDQRKSLNKLEEEIEKEIKGSLISSFIFLYNNIKEIESLNNELKLQNKMSKIKNGLTQSTSDISLFPYATGGSESNEDNRIYIYPKAELKLNLLIRFE